MIKAKQQDYCKGRPVWKCPKCNKNFQTKAIAEQHIRRNH